jgi:hypothetical protein
MYKNLGVYELRLLDSLKEGYFSAVEVVAFYLTKTLWLIGTAIK